ncbi:response regulator [Phormidium tenue FACHB-886]|nr:response regulator [Phormidium tenue FACHB-886]
MKFWKQTITDRVASVFLLLSLISVGIVGSVAFFRAREALKQAAFERLNVSATLKEEEIARWFEDQQRDFFLITQFPDIQTNLNALLTAPAANPAAYHVLSKYLQDIAKLKSNFSEIYVLDQRNRVIVSTHKPNEGQYAVLASVTYLYFQQIEPGETFDPIFYVSLTTGKPTVTLAAPIYNTAGTRQGVILANLNLDQIDQIVRERTGLGESGDTYLAGSLVDEFTFISRDSPLQQEFPEGISSEGIDAVMQGRSGSGLYRNYAGVPVIGVYRWLNNQDIALLVEMRQSEAFAPARQLAGTIVLVGLVSVAGLAIGVRWLAWQLQLSREQLERYSHQLEQKAQEADAANRSKSEFLANMSHELRTPLNAILGYTQLMTRDTAVNTTQLEQLHIINRSGEHLLTLINDVLEMTKIEAGRTLLNENSFNLYHLLNSLEEMFQLKASAKQLQLIFERDENVPEYVQTDEGKLRQVLINLIGNAIKFTLAGRVIVQIHAASELLHFEVTDTGVGIATDELKHLFEPFVQTESGRTSKQGTGLGLPISQKFVQLMGGEILVRSSVNCGSTFAFTIKFRPVVELVHQQSHQLVVGLAPAQPPYRILIVEDRWENRQLLVKLLAPLGFEIREAENGQLAIELWEQWQPHLIWMDMRMPVMDGYEATRRIRSHPQGQQPIIIALTASAFEEARSIILAAGCNDFVRKPFQEQIIFEKMTQYLGVQYLYASQEQTHPTIAVSGCAEVLQPSLSKMPLDWLEQLQQAATKVNAKQVLALITQIPPEQADLAQVLTNLVDRFQFEEIVLLAKRAADNTCHSQKP